MAYVATYTADSPSRAEIDALPGTVLLEFGANWCGHCQAAQPSIEAVLAANPGVRHLKVEDGPGRPLGRSYRVKLWPALIFLRGGQETARLVRPSGQAAIAEALARLNAA